MQFIDLQTQYRRIKPELQKRMAAVLKRGQFILGPEIKELEAKLAGYAGVKHCITCASGTDALLLPLMAYNVKPGDAVFTTPFTFFATAEVIALLGATPIFIDIDPGTFNLDPKKLEKTILSLKAGKKATPQIPNNLRLRGIIPVDIFGLCADYDEINHIAKKHGLFVLEDAAQSFGAKYKGRNAGSLADMAATSFYPSKPLGCYGEGGAIFTNHDKIAEIIMSLRVHGQGANQYDNIRIGINGRMDTLQATIVLAKIRVFEDELKRRQAVAQRYAKLLGKSVTPQFIPKNCTSAWAQYSVLSNKRDSIIAGLRQKNIPTAIYYPKPLHLQTALAYLGYDKGSMPVSEEIARKIFSLPMHPYLKADEQDEIAFYIKKMSNHCG